MSTLDIDYGSKTNIKSVYKTGYFTLSCRHTVTYKIWPQIGDEVLCIRCNAGVFITGYQFCLRCDTCQYARAFGLDKAETERQANKHSFRNPEHEVRVYNNYSERYMTIVGQTPSILSGIAT